MSDDKIKLSDLQEEIRRKRGLECSVCGCRDIRVYCTDSRRSDRVIRYRKCRHCGTLYVSIERIIKK